MDGLGTLAQPQRGSALRPLAKIFLATGALGLMIGTPAAAAHAPAAMAPYAVPLAVSGAAALIMGLLLSGAAALERRLIDAEFALIETRQELRAAVDALRSAPAATDERDPDRPARARRRAAGDRRPARQRSGARRARQPRA